MPKTNYNDGTYEEANIACAGAEVVKILKKPKDDMIIKYESGKVIIIVN